MAYCLLVADCLLDQRDAVEASHCARRIRDHETLSHYAQAQAMSYQAQAMSYQAQAMSCHVIGDDSCR